MIVMMQDISQIGGTDQNNKVKERPASNQSCIWLVSCTHIVTLPSAAHKTKHLTRPVMGLMGVSQSLNNKHF